MEAKKTKQTTKRKRINQKKGAETKKKIRQPIIQKPPMTAKCAICLEVKPWRTGVVCSHSETAYQEHWVCPSCFATLTSSKPVFPFKCVHPSCPLEYSDYEIFHLNLPSNVLSKWSKNALKEMKLESGAWRCPGCNDFYWLTDDFKGPTVRCAGCNKLYCRECNEPGHWGSTCKEVKDRKEALTKDEGVMESVQKQVKILKCPQLGCADKPAFFRGKNCNRVTCPHCQTPVCGNCGEVIQGGHFECTDDCDLTGCQHCPLSPSKPTQDLEYLPCGGSTTSSSCGSSQVSLVKPATSKPAERIVQQPPQAQAQPRKAQPVVAAAEDHKDREVPIHVDDLNYAAMLALLGPWELRRQMRN